MSVNPELRKLAAVMFTDIAGYTAMVQQDEASALQKVAIHRKHLEENTLKHQGRVIQFYGDGSLSIYDSVVDAVRCAISMQHGYAQEGGIPVRIGIHLGDFVMKDGSVFGDGVNLASRIQAEGIPGGILISEKVNRELVNHSDIHTTYIGRFALKNVSEPTTIYAVSVPGINVPPKKREVVRVVKKRFPYILLAAVLIVSALIFRFVVSGDKKSASFQEERIAVPAFIDLTNDPALSTVSKMASHWITTKLIETMHATVVSYPSAVESPQVAYASTGGQQYSNLTGAINVIEGTFQYVRGSKDSLEFSAQIINLITGVHLKIQLPHPRCSSADPMDCILELSNAITGFWESRGENVLHPPKYDAYKEFISARGAWYRDMDEAKNHLEKSIALDPEFIDAYFLLLSWYYNQVDYEQVANMIDTIEQRFPALTDRQSNYLRYHKADNAGKNTEAFTYFLTEYAIDPKDLFVNTSGILMAMDYVNAPREALKFFAQIDPADQDLSECIYCQRRMVYAIHAFQSLGHNRDARKVADALKDHAQGAQIYQKLIEYYVQSGDTSSANALLAKAVTEVESRYKPYLFLVAGRQAHLKGQNGLRDHYARLSATYARDSTRALARTFYLRDSLDRALGIYRDALVDAPDDMRIYGEMGMIYARKGLHNEAQQMHAKLDSLQMPFDYGLTPITRQGSLRTVETAN